MKFCPICKTHYDEEILRFCTKDGTPLIEEGEPNFTALPSEDELGEQTVIRRKTPPPIPSTAQPVPDFDDEEPARISSPRIVIPMSGEPEPEPARRESVRAMSTESVRRPLPSQKSNTPLIVFLTVLGTVVILAGATGVFWFLSNQNAGANQNANYNANLNSVDTNLNTNLSVDNSLVNFNSYANTNANANVNLNANANLKTPTPTRTPTPTPTPVSTNINSAVNTNANAFPPVNTRPSPRASPSATPPPPPPRPLPSATPPRPSPTNAPSNRPVNAGILNNRAVNLPKPAYPPLAKQMRAAGQVAVQVLVDEAGNVIAARATSGNQLLRASAEAAARQSKFSPVTVNNQPVPASGIVLYNFIN